MALTQFQQQVLNHLASNRSPNSVFAGGTVANRTGPRISDDFDIEHQSAESVRQSFALDEATLLAANYRLTPTAASQPRRGFIEAVVEKDGETTLLDWTHDTAIRFFPAVNDPDFGWRLHDADIALNKLLALAGRRAARDYYDVVRLHELGFPLAALAWAAQGKDAGMSPDLVLDEAARNSIYTASQLKAGIHLADELDPAGLKRTFLQGLAVARDLFPQLLEAVPETVGCMPIGRDGSIVVPVIDAIHKGSITFHAASVGGAWPEVLDVDAFRP